MKNFDSLAENYDHKFVRTNPQILKHLFGEAGLAPFWIADMEFPVAEAISNEIKRIAERGIYAYEFDSNGVFSSIVDWNKKRNSLELDKKAFIQVTGVLTGIAVLLRELSQAGDGVLIQTPVYHQFGQLIKSSGRKIVRNPLKIVNGAYEMDYEDLEEKLKSENVKLMLLCNPHNPIGRVWKKEELQRLDEIASKYQLTIISDEIHSDIIFRGHKFYSLMALGAKQHIALLGSPAKTFGMQSISNGYLYIPDEQMRKTVKKEVESMYLNHGNAVSTFATIAAYKHGETWLEDLLSYLENSLKWIEEFINNELPMVKMYPVEGTYQVWLDFRETKLSKDELEGLLTKKAKLALTPGSWFDKDSPLFMRMNIASPLSKIQTAFEQIKTALDEGV